MKIREALKKTIESLTLPPPPRGLYRKKPLQLHRSISKKIVLQCYHRIHIKDSFFCCQLTCSTSATICTTALCTIALCTSALCALPHHFIPLNFVPVGVHYLLLHSVQLIYVPLYSVPQCGSPPEIAARWRYRLLSNNLTHYNSQFCVRFQFGFDQEAQKCL